MTKVYTKNTWTDEVLDGDARYDILEDGGGAFKADMQINLSTTVTTPGTAVAAATMNNLENGVDDLDDILSAIQDGTNAATTLAAANLVPAVVGGAWKTITKSDLFEQIDDELGTPVSGGNYKLASSISSNDLVLALKDLDGNNFSAAAPLKIKLSDELATISAARSVTVPDGTNIANLGAAEHATQDVDLFTYLVDETGASAGTKLAWSRIPNGHVVGDFSSTNTNEKYLVGPTNYNATDKVQNIGRFNATLSAGAGYTWTIPATSIIKNRPTYDTRWLTWLPTFGNLTVGDGTLVSKYWISDDVLAIWFAFKYGATTSAIAGAVTISLPISISNAAVAASLGTCNLLDSGVGTTYGSIDSNGASANAIRIRVIASAAAYATLAPISATVPFTWAVNDEINFQLPSLPLA
jgi:hypothetical protein